jgi:hypothetical protein
MFGEQPCLHSISQFLGKIAEFGNLGFACNPRRFINRAAAFGLKGLQFVDSAFVADCEFQRFDRIIVRAATLGSLESAGVESDCSALQGRVVRRNKTPIRIHIFISADFQIALDDVE